ncbi:hypothetical protein [Bacillus sp. REN10]|uniref:tetratricopeptide repeat protein n=1 Tax=Bacillus sp. REN10 TaxID=2782541 RepID=UPI00193B61F7|nr:hypothetical protein [Bacillus sp. REN10]
MKTLENQMVKYINNRQYDEAINFLKECQKENPTDGEIYAWLAAVYGGITGEVNFAEKLSYLELLQKNILKAIEYSPNSKLVRRVNGIRLIKTPDEYGGNSEEGIAILLGLINEGERDYEVFLNIAVAYTEINNIALARKYIETALAIDPQGVEVHDLKKYIGIVGNEENDRTE